MVDSFIKDAELAELVDALDSGSSVRLGLPGSSPGFRIAKGCHYRSL